MKELNIRIPITKDNQFIIDEYNKNPVFYMKLIGNFLREKTTELETIEDEVLSRMAQAQDTHDLLGSQASSQLLNDILNDASES